MKVVALVSGGKDSCYGMMQCVAHGHEIVALANLRPSNVDELDSYMYQTVGHHALDLYSEALGLPLFRRTIQGHPVEQGKTYHYNVKDEVEDLYKLLKNIRTKLDFDGVAVGAILSDYQRIRVENVCFRLGLSCFAYLWRRDQKELLAEMISCHVEAVIIKVAAMGLEPQKHLGKHISEIYPQLHKLNAKYDCNICGEGGEYETFTIDCPLFKKKIVVDSSEVVIHSDDAFAPVGYLNLKEIHLEDKHQMLENRKLNPELLKDIPIFRGSRIKPDIEEINSFLAQMDVEGSLASNELHIFTCENQITTGKDVKDEIMVVESDGFASISGIKAYNSASCLKDEADYVMRELKRLLEGIGTCLQHVLLVHIYIKSMLQYAAVNSVYVKYFNLNPPSRVCVETNFLDSTVFQLDCLALIPGKTEKTYFSRDVMHVQSISHWAPANIGPYSQAVKVNNTTAFIAGCIGLWPSSMTLVEGGIDYEAPLALRHVQRILAAAMPGATLSSVISGTCYVTTAAHIPRARAAWLSNYKDSCGQEDRILYVVVPALPKAALIEWHVVCHHCIYLWKRDKLSQDNSKGIKISLTGFSCCTHKCGSIYGSTEVHLPAPKTVDTSIAEMVGYLIDTLDSFITTCGLKWNILLQLRIFFRREVFKDKHVQLSKVIREMLQRQICGKLPALVLIPVSRLGRYSELLSIGCWFQTCPENHED